MTTLTLLHCQRMSSKESNDRVLISQTLPPLPAALSCPHQRSNIQRLLSPLRSRTAATATTRRLLPPLPILRLCDRAIRCPVLLVIHPPTLPSRRPLLTPIHLNTQTLLPRHLTLPFHEASPLPLLPTHPIRRSLTAPLPLPISSACRHPH